MCGIGGILRVWPAGVEPPTPEVSIPETWLDILDASIKHRGPDGQGRFRDRARHPDGATVDVALVHRRLSILDHEGGAQPMVVSADFDTVGVVFNGYIANHGDLRRRLHEDGHAFKSDHSDTEAIAHGALAWGSRLFAHLNGMYALAVWSRADATLFLARDMYGEKPVYITSLGDDTAAFANSLGGLTRLRRVLGLPLSPDRVAAARAIARGGVSWNDTFVGIGQIGPGQWAQAPARRDANECAWQRDGFERTEWSVTGDAAIIARGSLNGQRPEPRDPERQVEELLAAAVRLRLDADVPVACLLSGGVDSSLVALMAKRHVPDIMSICVRMPDPGYDESSEAARVAQIIGTRHTTVDSDARPADDLVSLIGALGWPLGDSSLLPTYWACKAARGHAKVVLTGDGGDELFVGYERYMAERPLRDLAPLRGLARVLAASLPQSDPRARTTKAARFLRALGGAGYADVVAIFPSDDLAALCSREIAAEVLAARREDSGRVTDLHDNLPNVLLRKTDHASMSAGVELRAPFLDQTLARTVLPWPARVFTPRGQRKGLLRAVARKYLPASIVDRPKQGFAIPMGEWFRTGYGGMKTLLLDSLNSADPFPADLLGLELNRRFIRQMVDEHMNRRRDHSQRLYMLLVLAIWAKWLRGIYAKS